MSSNWGMAWLRRGLGGSGHAHYWGHIPTALAFRDENAELLGKEDRDVEDGWMFHQLDLHPVCRSNNLTSGSDLQVAFLQGHNCIFLASPAASKY
jgi:hypothetical protein